MKNFLLKEASPVQPRVFGGRFDSFRSRSGPQSLPRTSSLSAGNDRFRAHFVPPSAGFAGRTWGAGPRGVPHDSDPPPASPGAHLFSRAGRRGVRRGVPPPPRAPAAPPGAAAGTTPAGQAGSGSRRRVLRGRCGLPGRTLSRAPAGLPHPLAVQADGRLAPARGGPRSGREVLKVPKLRSRDQGP